MLSENLCLHTATNLSLHSCIFPCSHIYTSFIHISLTIQCFTQFLHTQSHNSLHSSFALQKLFHTALSLTHILLHHSHTLYSLCSHSFTRSQFSHSAHTFCTALLFSGSLHSSTQFLSLHLYYSSQSQNLDNYQLLFQGLTLSHTTI